MDPILGGALIGGGANLLGGFAGGISQGQANQANWDNARASEAFSERMSNTAYQRAVKDMKLAGINPMMAYTQGGASSPSGASATAQAAKFDDTASGVASSAKDYINQKRERQLMTSQVDLQDAQINVAKSQQGLNASSARRANADAKLLEAELPAAQSRSRLENQRNQIDEKAVMYDAVMNRAAQAFGTGASAVQLFRGGRRGIPTTEPGRISAPQPSELSKRPYRPKTDRMNLTPKQVDNMVRDKRGNLIDKTTGEIYD